MTQANGQHVDETTSLQRAIRELERKLDRARDTIAHLRDDITRLRQAVELGKRNLRDFYIGQSIAKARGETNREVAADAERLGDHLMLLRMCWEAGQSASLLSSPDSTTPIPAPTGTNGTGQHPTQKAK